jgi:ribonucleotide reductase beta subunit family protein with ferritin-like domain
MDRICFDSKDNFFEGRVTSYQMAIEKTDKDNSDTLAFDEDF